MLNFIKKYSAQAIISSSVVAYMLVAQFIGRTTYGIFENTVEFYGLLGFVLILLGLTTVLFNSKEELYPQKIIITAILYRLPFLFIIPNLSDDFYRFIWDGALWNEGINPYTILPKDLISQEIFTGERKAFFANLFEGMNSKGYYTIYPTIPQIIFYCATLLGGNSIFIAVVTMRLFILGFEMLGAHYLIKLLKNFHIDPKYALLYLLNPLLIIESTGNLHHEGIMISFLIIAIYQLVSKKNLFSAAAFFALSIGTKLLPLIILPLLLKQLGFKKFMKFFMRLALFLVLIFIPLLVSKVPENFLSSVDLYFQKFEFNASIYYLCRWYGQQLLGYNPIQTLAPILSIISFISILLIAFRSKENDWELFFQSALTTFFIYYLFSTIVHPWYVINLLFFGIFTKYRYPIIWSAAAFLSYATYLSYNYTERLYLTSLEYGMVISFLVYEQSKLIIKKRKKIKVIKLYRDN